MKTAWTWRSVEEKTVQEHNLKTWAWEATPLMIDGVLYITTSLSQVAAVEAQHRAILLAVAALLGGGAADLITLPPDAAKLPKAAGGVGFPDAFYPTSMASPSAEGAVR